MKRMTKDSWLCQRPIAHRGLHSAACPENSLAAVERAVHEGYPVEIDVHLLKSGELAVFHDEDFSRMAGKRAKIKDTDLAGLQRMSLRDSDEKIPLLDEVLALVAGRIPVVIEVKATNKASLVGEALVSALTGYEGDFVVQSYDPLFLRWLFRHAPRIHRGQILGRPDGHKKSFWKGIMNGKTLFHRLGRPDFLVLDIENLNRKQRERFVQKGWILLGYTVKEKSVFDKLESLFDNLVFEGFTP